ncbi:MAG: HAD family hydrolase [Deltaproteobacteria bacterium]
MDKLKAVFLDRDGTIIYDVGYPKDPKQVQLLPGVVEALTKIKGYGFQLVMVSNQSGVGRGRISSEEAESVHHQVLADLDRHGIKLDAFYYCFHSPEERCSCRKPSPEMLVRAAKELDINLVRSFMVGDKQIDIEAGKRAGCKTIFMGNNFVSGNLVPMPDFIASNWSEALPYILDK